MVKPIESIKFLVEGEEDRKNIPAETSIPGGEGVTEAQKATVKEPREKQRRKRNTNKTGDVKGICPKSPSVRLLEDEKKFLKRLEAHILLETGETISDHQLIMDAVREYTKKHHPDFQ